MKAFSNTNLVSGLCEDCDCDGFVPVLTYNVQDGSITFVEGSTYPSGDAISAVVINVEDNEGNKVSGRITTAGGSVVLDTTGFNQNNLNIRATIVSEDGCVEDLTWEDAQAGANGLARPNNFNVTATSPTETTSEWDAVPNADGYVLQRAEDEDFTVGLATVYTGPLLEFDDTGLTTATEYFYRVRATSSGSVYGDSVYSEDSVTTP